MDRVLQTVTIDTHNLETRDVNGNTLCNSLDIIKCLQDPDRPSQSLKRFKVQEEHLDEHDRVVFLEDNFVDDRNALRLTSRFTTKSKQAVKVTDTVINMAMDHLHPTQALIDDLQDRLDGCESSEKLRQSRYGNDTFQEHHIYVRAALPQEFAKLSARASNCTKPFNSRVVKFGHSCSIKNRHNDYSGDNGFFAASFQCICKGDATAAETILRTDLRDIVVYDSREYINTAMLAKIFKMDYEEENYSSYLAIVYKLFCAFVQRLKILWPHNYPPTSYGTLWNIEQTQESALRFVPRTINDELACDMGFGSANTLAALIPLSTQRLVAGGDEASSSSSDTKLDATQIITYNLATGKECPFANLAIATKKYGIGDQIKVIERTRLGQPRQALGMQWRRGNDSHPWVPPEGFTYFTDSILRNDLKYVAAVHHVSGKQRVYESAECAAQLIPGVDARALRDHCKAGSVYCNRTWRYLTLKEIANSGAQTQSTNVHPVTRADIVSVGNIISRDIVTGQECMFISVQEAESQLRISCSAIERVLNEPRQVGGKAFRTADAAQRWEPHPLLYFDANEKKGGVSIVSFNPSKPDEVTGVFESYKTAAEKVEIAIDHGHKVFPQRIEKASKAWRHDNPTNAKCIVFGHGWRRIDEEVKFIPVDVIGAASMLHQPRDTQPEFFASPEPGCSKVIERNILTGKELAYTCIMQAAEESGLHHRTIERLLGTHLHIRGKMYRREGEAIPIVPDGFTIDASAKTVTQRNVLKYMQCFMEDGSLRVFEAQKLANKFASMHDCSEPEPYQDVFEQYVGSVDEVPECKVYTL